MYVPWPSNHDTHKWSVVGEHDDVIKWKHFPRYWPFVWGIHRWPVNSPHKGQLRGALMFSLICTWSNSWAIIEDAGDLRRHRTHYGVTVMVAWESGARSKLASNTWSDSLISAIYPADSARTHVPIPPPYKIYMQRYTYIHIQSHTHICKYFYLYLIHKLYVLKLVS